MNRVDINGVSFYDDEMRITDMHLSYSPTGENLDVGSISIRINTTDSTKLAAIRNMKYGAQIDFYRGNDQSHEGFITADPEELFSKIPNYNAWENFMVADTAQTFRWVATFFAKLPEKINGSDNAYQIQGFDIFGLLSTVEYPGMFMPVGNPASTGVLLTSVFQTVPNVSRYSMPDVASLANVTGLLQKQNARDALQKILFAYGISVENSPLGSVPFQITPRYFAYLNGGASAKPVTDGTYIDGNVKTVDTVSRITLYEHSFIADRSADYTALYDNTSASTSPTNEVIEFEFPVLEYPMYVTDASDNIIYQIDANGNKTVDTGVWSRSNAGYLSWTISGRGIVYGVEYTHVETPVVWENPAVYGEANEIVVRDNYLINSFNSDYIMQRLRKYYVGAIDVDSSFVISDSDFQLPQDLISFTDAFKVARTGYIMDSEITPSAIMKSVSKIVSNWTPGPFGSQFNNFMLVTASGTVTIPAAAVGQPIRVVLIGGGQGGQSGYTGTDGDGQEAAQITTSHKGGAGGAKGTGGQPGKSLVVDIASAASSYAAVIGAGGAYSNSYNGVVGNEGGNTTFGGYSSADGAINPTGVINQMTGDVYATYGTDGYDGGAGGDSLYAEGTTGSDDGETIYTGDSFWLGGSGGAGFGYADGYAYGGGGGGAAYGRKGRDGGVGVNVDNPPRWLSGYGGDGASAVRDSDSLHAAGYGCGGDGGNGGGGGGAAGIARCTSEQDTSSILWQSGGAGGLGSLAYNGGSGLIIIYY